MTRARDGLRERARRADHDERQLAFLRSEAARLGALLEERRSALAGKTRDVEKLEAFSLSNLLLRVLESKEACLELERREQIEARLRFEQTRDELQRIEARIAELEGTAAARLEVLRERQAERDRQRTAIEARGGRSADRLAKVEARLEGNAQRLLEAEAAAADCAEAREASEGLTEDLKEAWSHGATDLLAVGLQANFAAQEGKRESLNRAHEHFAQGVAAVHRLEQARAGSEPHLEPEVRLPWGNSIADWWLDGVVADWLTQRRLSRALERTTQVLAALAPLERRLRAKLDELEGELSRDRRLLRELLGA